MSESGTTIGPAERDPRAATTFLVGGVGVILLVVILILLEVLFYRTVEAEHRRKVVNAEPAELRQLEAQQVETLSSYRWIDRERGIVAIPIERAMERIVEEHGGDDGAR